MSDLAGLIASAERLAEHFEQETTRLDLLVSGLAGESMPDAETMKQPHGHSLATLSDSQDRMRLFYRRVNPQQFTDGQRLANGMRAVNEGRRR